MASYLRYTLLVWLLASLLAPVASSAADEPQRGDQSIFAVANPCAHAASDHAAGFPCAEESEQTRNSENQEEEELQEDSEGFSQRTRDLVAQMSARPLATADARASAIRQSFTEIHTPPPQAH